MKDHSVKLKSAVHAFFDDLSALNIDYDVVLSEEFQCITYQLIHGVQCPPNSALRSRLSHNFLWKYYNKIYPRMLFFLELIIDNDEDERPIKDVSSYIAEAGVIILKNNEWIYLEYILGGLSYFSNPTGLKFIALLVEKLKINDNYYHSTYGNYIFTYLLYLENEESYNFILANQNLAIGNLAEDFEILKERYEEKLGFGNKQ
jgi:hypothetical protein